MEYDTLILTIAFVLHIAWHLRNDGMVPGFFRDFETRLRKLEGRGPREE